MNVSGRGRARRLRSIAAATAVLLAAEAAVLIESSGQAVAVGRAAAASTGVDAKGLGPAEAQDRASALLTARLQQRRIEVLDARTDASQTFANPDGTLTVSASAEPVRVLSDGQWVPLDATLKVSGPGTVAPVRSESALVLSGGGTGPLARMTVDGKELSLSWPAALPEPVLAGATATYPNVLASGVDLQLTATVSGGVEETLVVKNAEAAADPALADLALATSTSKGSTLSADAGGNLSVKDPGGRTVVTSPAPVMWDSATSTAPAPAADSPAPAPAAAPGLSGGANAAGSEKVKVASRDTAPATRSSARVPGSHAHQGRVKVRLDRQRLHLAPDASMLSATGTVFPLYIDPAFVPHPASGTTLHYAQVQQGYPTTSNYDAAPGSGLGVGYQGFSTPKGIERSYYALSVPAEIYNSRILSATFNTKVTYAAASGSNSTTVNAFSTCGIDATTTWNNQPCHDSRGNANYPGPNAAKTFTTTGQSPNQALSFDITASMQLVAQLGYRTWDFELANATETDSTDLVRFSANPTYSITYDTPPATPTGLTAAPTATAGYTAGATPTLSASATDANSDTVRLDYQILSGTTVKSSGSSAFVNPGTAAPWTGTTKLADGPYAWQARAWDGNQYSAWTAAQPLTVDTTAPANTTVTSKDFTANSWSGTPDASGSFTGDFTLTPPSTDAATVAMQLDDGPWTSTATTGAPFTRTLTFKAGKHTLIAKTHDAAGNLATGTYYVFYAGAGAALTSPNTGDRPARRVNLTAQGLTGYTGATYQYRLGETDTWHNVPAKDVRRNTDGSTPAAWPVPVTGGAPAPLTWNITDTLAEDSPVDLRVLFTDGTATAGSPVATVTLDRDAGTAPALTAGPASVNALTGDATLSATDASAFGMTVTRSASSRRPANGSQQEGQASIFGPQWTAGTTAEVTDSDWSFVRKTSLTSVALVDKDGNQTGFTAAASGGWKPEPGAEALTLTGSLAGSFTLKDDDGTTTVFTKSDGALTTWQVSSTFLPTSNSTTTVTYQTVTVNGVKVAHPKYMIAPTSAVDAATCQTTTAAGTPATGCRVMEYLYAVTTTGTSTAFGDFAGQVKEIRLWTTEPGATAGSVKVLAHYTYDDQGRLRETSDPRTTPNLKTSYTYDSDGRVTTQADPGQLPWTFNYAQVGTSPVAGKGMLTSASRPALKQGSATDTDGTASTTVVYNVPLAGANAPNAMGPTDVAAWSQSDAPSDATALFPADQEPKSSDGSALGKSDYQRATVTYTDASGRQVNTAAPGGRITTTEYDQYGNTVRELSAGNRELALGTADWQAAQRRDLGIDGKSTAERATALSTVTTYNTTAVPADAGSDKDTDPTVTGQRKLEETGPLHQVTLAAPLKAGTGGTDLPAGAVTPAREHTRYAYDQGRPTDGTATTVNQTTTTSVGALVDGYPADGDVHTSTTAYDWAKGLPVKTVNDPAGLKITKTTTYDAQGRVTSTTLPKSTGNDAGTTRTTYWSATGTGTCQGHPEWADLTCSTGPAADITSGGSNPTQLPTKTTTYDRYGNPAAVTETANSTTRTTTDTYDNAGRPIKVAVSGGTGTAVADTTTAYDPATGSKTSVTADGRTVGYTYDALGRQIQYTDGNGGTTSTAYDALDRPVTVTDNLSTTGYTYNSEGQVVEQTDSVAGTTRAEYDADGQLTAEHLPGSTDLLIAHDTTGQVTGRAYTRNGTAVTGDYARYTVHGQQAAHSADTGLSAYQANTYDAAGRLTAVSDTQGTTTTRRGYTFDADTNRTALTTSVDNPDGTAGTPTSTNYTYDSADRLQTANATVYDAFGRTIAQADGSQLAYFTNDLVQRETNGATRQTWTLDPAGRPAAWSTESSTNGTWTTTATKANHYNGDSDSPAWTTEDATGTVTRNVHGIDGDLAATTDATGNTVLQLANIHGDTTVQLPLDTAKNPGAQSADEYGNPTIGTPTSRYGWLGAKQRSAETPTGLVLMGVRLYNPATGRFLSVDPVPGGSDNGYEYGGGDPVNHFDLDGRMWGGSWFQQKWRNPNVRHWVYGVRAAAAVVSPVKKIRFVGRAIRNPSRTLRACARASIWGKKSCYSSLTGIPSALNYGRKAIRNYSYMRDYNRALTYTDRENICRRYTGYRGRGSCD
ncbi:RHS repeat-associated core domain-containing protein [Streptacidiphilus albus]|uniref:RHS repeat-associated core domain-containing protein n=1 Tax=Streptacidiphilus albus TaxID=105425 RepID=UPI0005AAEA37|nr:RHS repeat-associated core domain-containing protein [Streptacidiphilus albus]